MAAVSLHDAKASRNPPTAGSKKITELPNALFRSTVDGTTLCKMWDGDGFNTHITALDDIRLTDVAVTCGLCLQSQLFSCYSVLS